MKEQETMFWLALLFVSKINNLKCKIAEPTAYLRFNDLLLDSDIYSTAFNDIPPVILLSPLSSSSFVPNYSPLEFIAGST